MLEYVNYLKLSIPPSTKFDLPKRYIVKLYIAQSMITQDEVIDKLRQCLDPELGINIVDLGLIYSINIEGSRVNVLMTLTTSGCPLDSYFTKDITNKLKKIKGISDAYVEFTFEPPWGPTKLSEEAKDILGFVN